MDDDSGALHNVSGVGTDHKTVGECVESDLALNRHLIGRIFSDGEDSDVDPIMAPVDEVIEFRQRRVRFEDEREHVRLNGAGGVVSAKPICPGRKPIKSGSQSITTRSQSVTAGDNRYPKQSNCARQPATESVTRGFSLSTADSSLEFEEVISEDENPPRLIID